MKTSSLGSVRETRLNSSSPPKRFHKLSRRMTWTLRIFVMLQIAVGVICLNMMFTLTSYKNGQHINTNKESHGMRNIREFTLKGTAHPNTLFTTQTTPKPLPLCPEVPPGLFGRVKIDMLAYEMVQVEKKYASLQNGGRFKPRFCTARQRVAIIIPYRSRKQHLITLMNNLHSILQRQQLDYGIYVVEVAPLSDFNRALSLNIGFTEAFKEYDYQCFIFHDVDLLPENDRNMYTCSSGPRHMSVAVDKLKYKLPYGEIFGGVVSMTKEHFMKVNGFSNKFFGWGGEDDNMYVRINATHLNVTRYKPDIARYRMLSHKKDPSVNNDRFYLLKHTNETWQTDGLNTLTYKLIKTERHRLFTYILVDIDPALPAYYTDRLKIVAESIRKMREESSRTTTPDLQRNREQDVEIPYQLTNSSRKSVGSLPSIQLFMSSIKRLLIAEMETEIPDAELASFVRDFATNMREAGFSIGADLKFKKDIINEKKSEKMRKIEKVKDKQAQMPNGIIAYKPKSSGSVHPMHLVTSAIKKLLIAKKERKIDTIPDAELATLVRDFVNNLREAGFSVGADLRLKKNVINQKKSDKTRKVEKVKYTNEDKDW